MVLYLLLLSWLLLPVELLMLLWLSLETWLGCLNLCSHWLSAQLGKWQWCKAVLMCSSSLSSKSCVEETVLALCARVLYTLCLAMWWLLSQWRYWSVCVGFLYTEVLSVLSGWMVTKVSRNSNDPCWVGSTVNCIFGSWLFMCCSRSWLCSALLMTKVSSTNLSHTEGGMGERLEGFNFKLFHEDVCYEWDDWGSHSCSLYLLVILTLEEEVGLGEAEHQ